MRLYQEIIEWLEIERTFKYHLVPIPMPWIRSLATRSPSNLTLNTSRDGESTGSLSNLFSCLITFIMNNFFLTSNLNLLFYHLKPLCVILPLYLLVQRFSSSFLKATFESERLLKSLPGDFFSTDK